MVTPTCNSTVCGEFLVSGQCRKAINMCPKYTIVKQIHIGQDDAYWFYVVNPYEGFWVKLIQYGDGPLSIPDSGYMITSDDEVIEETGIAAPSAHGVYYVQVCSDLDYVNPFSKGDILIIDKSWFSDDLINYRNDSSTPNCKA